MWYETEEEAKIACIEKERKYREEFVVLKDSSHPNCYWAQRKSSLLHRSQNASPRP